MDRMLETLARKKIPVFWFAIFLLLWVITYISSYLNQAEHLKKMDAFMNAGGRFTLERGERLEARVAFVESQVYALTLPDIHRTVGTGQGE